MSIAETLYDLKQTYKYWNVTIYDALIKNEYVQSKYDYSMLFTKKCGDDIGYCWLYVDDLLTTGNSEVLIA